MGIGAEPAAAGLAPVALQVLFREPPFEKGARIDAGRRVRLEIDDVAAALVSAGAEEMIEADLEDFGGGSVARDMAAEFARGEVRAHDHRQRVPAHDRRDPLLEREIAGKGRLLLRRDRVLIGRDGRIVHGDAEFARAPGERGQKKRGAFAARVAEDRVERIQPLAGLRGIIVGRRA